MCGFVGLVHLDGQPVDGAVLAHMAESLNHRGPDDEGHLLDGAVGLFHKRLSIIDLASGHQPMTVDDATVVFNGEIYNYVELRDDLRRRGHAFKTSSDTEVILRMYLEHGPELVRHLNGMFSFLIYDRRRHQIITARDPFGIKPLYVHRDERRLVFASEIKAVLRHPEINASLDQDALQDYFTFQFVLGEHTLFQGVRKVPPGHYQVVDLTSGRISTVQYWEPRFTVDPYHTEEYFVVELRSLIEDAVRIQMRSDVPVGGYLSGGVDSSLVSTLASRVAPDGFHVFNGLFEEGIDFDESRYAREVAEANGSTLVSVVPTYKDFVDLLPKLIYHMDEPVAGPGLFPQYMVSREAATHVKVCLGGQGGDEIFGGYARYMVAYLEQALKGAIFETNEEREHIVSLASIIPHLPSLKQYTPMLKQFWSRGAFEAMDRRYFQLIDRSAGALNLLSADLRESRQQDAVFERFQRVFNHPHTLSYYNKMTHFDMVAGLPALLHVEDRVSMAASLESRVPLLDHRIADLVGSMPPVMKFKGGQLKYILKKATRDLLPASIFSRKDKMGFPVPLHLWARNGARGFLEDVLLDTRARGRGLFDPVEIRALLGGESAYGRALWGVLNIELWYRQFIDGEATTEPIRVRNGSYAASGDTLLS